MFSALAMAGGSGPQAGAVRDCPLQLRFTAGCPGAFQPQARTHAHQGFEGAGEVAEAGEAAAVGHIGEGQRGLVKQIDNLTETSQASKLAWAEAGVLAKSAFELTFTEREIGAEGGHTDVTLCLADGSDGGLDCLVERRQLSQAVQKEGFQECDFLLGAGGFGELVSEIVGGAAP